MAALELRPGVGPFFPSPRISGEVVVRSTG
jgi:hypothetical protein